MELQSTQLLHVLPPISSFLIMHVYHLAGLIDAHLIIYQRMNAESFSDGWNATKVDSHANVDQFASDGYSWEENIGDWIYFIMREHNKRKLVACQSHENLRVAPI